MSDTATQTTNTVDAGVSTATDTSATDGSQSTGQGTDGSQSTDAGVTATDDGKSVEYTDFKLPDGVTLDQSFLDDLKAQAKELKLDQDAAQKFVDFHASNIKVQNEAFESTKETWKQQTSADPEIGGAKLQDTLFMASKVVQQYGTDALKAVLDESGIGNHPEIVRLFAKIGRDISEDGAVSSRGNNGELSPEERINNFYNKK